jgi:hypothetical protein
MVTEHGVVGVFAGECDERMESGYGINLRERAFIMTPQRLHVRLPGGIIDRGQHCDSMFLFARRPT